MAHTFGRKFRSYKDEESANNGPGPFYVTQLESAHKLLSLPDVLSGKLYHLLIFDEIESLLKQLTAKTVHYYLDTIQALYHLISRARFVICYDAFIGPRTIDFFAQWHRNGFACHTYKAFLDWFPLSSLPFTMWGFH